VKKSQWLTLLIGLVLTGSLYFFGRTVPAKKTVVSGPMQGPAGGMQADLHPVSTDSMLVIAKKRLNADQVTRINMLENSVTRGDLGEQQVHVYHQLARFWADTARVFEPYAWYTGEAARLENSEKSLTFAAQLFLESLQQEEDESFRQWKALQAKDLFERSLKINPGNDSARVGLGASLLFGNIAATPMEGIGKIREVVNKDSTNIYAQMTLVRGSLISGQYDKAISRLQSVNRMKPGYLDATLLLAEVYEQMGKNPEALEYYRKSLELTQVPEVRKAIEERIGQLKK